MTDSRTAIVERALIETFILNVFDGILMITAGVVGGSAILIAAGLHAISHLLLTGVSWIGARIAAYPPDETCPGGYGRVEVLTSLIVYLSLIVVGWEVVMGSWNQFQADGPPTHPPLILVAAPLLESLLRYLFAKRLIRFNERQPSHVLRATAVHQRADALAGLVLAGALMAASQGRWWQIDVAAAAVVGIIIAWSGVRGAFESFRELIFETADEEVVRAVRQAAVVVEPGYSLSSLSVRQVGHRRFVDIVLRVPADTCVASAKEQAEALRSRVVRTVPSLFRVQVFVAASESEADSSPAPSQGTTHRREDGGICDDAAGEQMWGSILRATAFILTTAAVVHRSLVDLDGSSPSGVFVRLALVAVFVSVMASYLGVRVSRIPQGQGIPRWAFGIASLFAVVIEGGMVNLVLGGGILGLVIGAVPWQRSIPPRCRLAKDVGMLALVVAGLEWYHLGDYAAGGRTLVGGILPSLQAQDGIVVVGVLLVISFILGIEQVLCERGRYGRISAMMISSSFVAISCLAASLWGSLAGIMLLVGPVFIARIVERDADPLALSFVIGAFAAVVGLRASLHTGLPSGSAVMVVLTGVALVAMLPGRVEGRP